MTRTLEIQGLHVEVDGKEILKGVDLTMRLGETHALMGPNGSGKSTLAHTLLGHPRYKVTKGKMLLDGQDIAALPPDERAKLGLFLSFQHPPEISGVTVESFLRLAYNTVSGKRMDVVGFHQLLTEQMQRLRMDASFARRYLNSGFSGGEKKRMETLQLCVLDPAFAVLDETDSGLDVDALKAVADGIKARQDKEHATLLITHFPRILKLVEPDVVHIMMDGRIVETGGKDLAQEIEAGGYDARDNGAKDRLKSR